MHTFALLSLLFTTTTLAFPRPQAFLTGIPSVYIPENRAGCIGGMPYCHPKYLLESERASAEQTNDKVDDNVDDKVNKVDDKLNNAVERDLVAVKETRQEDEAGVFYCKDVGWGGQCLYHTSPLGSAPRDCTMLNLSASSIGPDQGYYCIFYTNAVCAPLASDGSDTLTLSYPGTDNLGFTDKGDFNDRLLSYQCFREEEVLDPELGTPKDADVNDAEGTTE